MDIDDLIKRANQGDAEAQNRLGMCYYKGIGVEQSYEKAVYWFEQVAEQGGAKAQYNLGMFYYEGIGVEQSYEKAVYWIEQAAEQEDVYAQSYLGFCYLHGIGKEQNFKEAERLYKEAVKNGYKEDEYNTRIFDNLQEKPIQQIKDISEEFDEENVGAVLISPQENKEIMVHTLYDKKTYEKIKEKVNEILEDVEEVNPNKDNEFDVFIKIYTKLGRMISYDYQAAGKPGYEARNMIGGLIKGKCVCAGYAEILRNVLSCRGIECICVSSNTHVFNQVKIGGKWYYCDLTNSTDSLNLGQDVEYCLLSKEEFEDHSSRIAMKNQIVYPSPESYPQEKVEEAVRRIINSEQKDLHKEVKESSESGIEEQIGNFAGVATLTNFQEATNVLENDYNKDKDGYKEVTEDSFLEQ